MNSDILLNKIIYKVLNENNQLNKLQNFMLIETEPTGGNGNEVSIDQGEPGLDVTSTTTPEQTAIKQDLNSWMEENGISDISTSNLIGVEGDSISEREYNELVNQLAKGNIEETEWSVWSLDWWARNGKTLLNIVVVAGAYMFFRTSRGKGGPLTIITDWSSKIIGWFEKYIIKKLFPPANTKPGWFSIKFGDKIRNIFSLGNLLPVGIFKSFKKQWEGLIEKLYKEQRISKTTQNGMIKLIRDPRLYAYLVQGIRNRILGRLSRRVKSGEVTAAEVEAVFKNEEGKWIPELNQHKDFKTFIESMKNTGGSIGELTFMRFSQQEEPLLSTVKTKTPLTPYNVQDRMLNSTVKSHYDEVFVIDPNTKEMQTWVNQQYNPNTLTRSNQPVRFEEIPISTPGEVTVGNKTMKVKNFDDFSNVVNELNSTNNLKYPKKYDGKHFPDKITWRNDVLTNGFVESGIPEGITMETLDLAYEIQYFAHDVTNNPAFRK